MIKTNKKAVTNLGKPNIVLWDLETSNLNANFGFILCAGYKILGEKKVCVPSIADYSLYKKDPTNDRELVKDVGKFLTDADIWVGHYACYFDIPFLNSRLLYHGLPPLPKVPLVDTWRIARNNLKLNSNRLQSITEFLEMEDKTAIKGPHWIKAMAGNKKSLTYVIEHCRQDVVVLEQVYNKIKVLHSGHPNINILNSKTNGCPVCGSEKLQKRGWNIAGVSRSQRYQCQSCGAWSRGRPERIKSLEVR